MSQSTASLDPDHPALALAFRHLSDAAGPRPDVTERRKSLAALARALGRHEDGLIAAVDADFGGRTAAETRLLELLPLYDQIAHARRHLRGWMRRRRVAGSRFLWPARAFYERHGWRAVRETDGENEEGAPDVRYVWGAHGEAG